MAAPSAAIRLAPLAAISGAARSNAKPFMVLMRTLTAGWPSRTTISNHWCPTRSEGAMSHFELSK